MFWFYSFSLGHFAAFKIYLHLLRFMVFAFNSIFFFWICCLVDWLYSDCLLYTSDAADDMQCVDLGGRRIIKKWEAEGCRLYD